MSGDILQRLRDTDWRDKPESTIFSQLIMPMLVALGYGEHTLHKVTEQRTYRLTDPTASKVSRRVRLDYQPRVYEEGLWVMEAKGSDEKVDPATLGQVRDYAIHSEVRAPLMVTVDAAGVRVFDPWAAHWDEPIVAVSLNEIADRIDELRSVLGADRVADVVRRRHLDHLRRALSASLEFDALAETKNDVAQIFGRSPSDDQRKTAADLPTSVPGRAGASRPRAPPERRLGRCPRAEQRLDWLVPKYARPNRSYSAQPEVQRPTQFMVY